MRKSIIPQEFVQCPSCGIVHSDPGLDLSEPSNRAPCCGASGESRRPWVPAEAVVLLDLVEDHDRDSDEGRRVAVVFLASAIEMLLEHVLVHLLHCHTSSEGLIDTVLSGYESAHRRRELFEKLSKQKIKNILKANNMRWFLDDWVTLVELRNKVGHGKAYAVSTADDDLILGLEHAACQAFVHLYNAVTLQAAPSMQPKAINALKLPFPKPRKKGPA